MIAIMAACGANTDVRRPVRGIDVVIIGAGHNGFGHEPLSRRARHRPCRAGARRGGQRWRHERWDSLRLLTPNWLSRLPGYHYNGDDPDGYMSREEVVAFIAGYARASLAPVLTGTTVTRLQTEGTGYRVSTDHGDWCCRAVVIASGAFNQPVVPRLATDLPAGIAQLTPFSYRNPSQTGMAACWWSAPRRPVCSPTRYSAPAAP